MWCQHFTPDTFLEQTAATFAASLRGRAKALEIQAEQRISLAWHTAAFSGAAQGGKLKALSKYLPSTQKVAQTADDMLDTLRVLQDMGAPMTIEQIN